MSGCWRRLAFNLGLGRRKVIYNIVTWTKNRGDQTTLIIYFPSTLLLEESQFTLKLHQISNLGEIGTKLEKLFVFSQLSHFFV